MKNKTKVVQVSNIAPQATKDQLSSLFSFMGKIDDIRLFPIIRDVAIPVQSRICFIKFSERDTVGVAQHLTNVVFIDRALLVIPYVPGEMPDEPKAIELLNSSSNFPNIIHEVPWPSHVKTEIDGIILRTTDPELTKQNLPEYPNLPATTESFKVNEIRRTVVFDNLAPATTADQLEEFASAAGDVKFLRLGDVDPVTGKMNALVEYCSQTAVPPALCLQSLVLNGSQVNVNHSTVAVVKPVTKSNDAAVREIEEAMQRVKQAQSMLTAVDPMALIDSTTLDPMASKSRSRSQSRRCTRSPSRRKSRSRSHSRSHRHRSRSDRRSRSRKRSRSRRRSRSRKKSRSRSRKRSRSRSPRASKSSRKDKDRDKDKKRSSRERKDKDKDKDKDKEKDKSKDARKDKSSSNSKEAKEKKGEGTEQQLEQGEQDVKEKINEIAEQKLVEGELQQQEIDGNPTQVAEGGEAVKEGEVETVQQDAPKIPSEDKRSKKDKGRSPEKKSKDKDRSHRRSRSGSPRRSSRRRSKSRSRSPGRRKKHRSRSRDRRKSRSPGSRSTRRSASPSHRRDRRSHSRDKKESGSNRDRRDKDRKEKEKEESSRDRDRKDKDRHRDRDKDRDRKDKKKERKDKDEKRDKEKKDDKEKDEKKDSVVCRNYDEEEMGYEKSDNAKREARASPAVDMDISP
ncbi:RNA recognition motif domain [Trinorchestia longiramus]|nr:RNA recognition motif domain [Trinorchestia longiramus]